MEVRGMRHDQRRLQKRLWPLVCLGMISALLFFFLLSAPAALAVNYPFQDNVEDLGSNYWLADSPWARVTTSPHSPSYAWTDSPASNYANKADVSLTLSTSINLTAGVNPQIAFWYRCHLEDGHDVVQVEISLNGGTSWDTEPLAVYTGYQPEWAREQIDLSPYASCTQAKIRFRLLTDDTVVRDGFYLDDVTISDLPLAVTVSPASKITHNSLTLSWSKATEPDFVSYEIYRSTAQGVSPLASLVALVASITDIATTSFDDVGLVPKTTYYYKVYIKDTRGMLCGSNEQSAVTLFGQDYPFADNMEAGAKNWLPAGDWMRISPKAAHSGTVCWTDSPLGNYPPNSDTSLELLDLREINPDTQLVFWHQLDIGPGDTAAVEVSKDGGFTWTAMKTYTNQKITSWQRVQIDLGDSAETVKIRFRLQSDNTTEADGWYIDDVTLSDIPAAVTLDTPVPQTPKADQMAVSWAASADTYFQCYALYRSTSPSVDLSGTLVTTITDPGTRTFMDSGLGYTTTYYYRVYVVNLYGAYNGSNVTSAKTSAPGGVVGFPYSDDMESGQGYWVAGSPWGLTNAISHSGSYSWTESPQGSYGNNANASLQLNIKLANVSRMPTLTYWQRYAIELNKDYGFLEVSKDGGSNWTRLSYITGTSTSITGSDGGWVREQVDLAEYAAYERVSIRFRFVSDGSGNGDGWYIDDIAIGEPTASIAYPFLDTMDNEQTKSNWCSSSWELAMNSRSAPYGWTDSPLGNYVLDPTIFLSSSLILANTIDLSSSKHPQLIFWHHYDIWNTHPGDARFHQCYGYVQVSNFCGQAGTWDTLATFYGTQADWVRVQLDLSNYVGLSQVRVRFCLWGYSDNDAYGGEIRDGWYIDDVNICEKPGSTGPVDWCNLDRPTGVVTVPGMVTPPIYGRVFEPGLTDRLGQGDGIMAQLGYGAVDSTPGGSWTWVNATYSGDTQDQRNDEYIATLTVSTIGNYHYAYRFSMNNGETWIYADLNGNDTGSGGSNTYTSNQAGALTVVPALSRIDITPDRAAILNNTQLQFTATGYDASNKAIPGLQNVVWQINGPIGSITKDGLFTAASVGVASISGSIESNGIKKDTSIITVIGNAGGTTQYEGGKVHNADLKPAGASILFNAYISSRPDEILTQDSPGCAYSNGEWGINIGNFPSAWSSGETLTVDFIDTAKGETGKISYALQASGQSRDITLQPISYSLVTTSTTDVNCIVLVKNSGITDAEGLVNNIPNASEVAYWDANTQSYVAHSKGSGLFNFPVTAGYPYFVTVSADTVWTPAGSVPDPWPTFKLITTGLTDVNTIGLPLSMMRLVRAQEVCQVIPNVKEVAFWDAAAQSYEAHTKGTPLNNFKVSPGMPLFLTMAEQESWKSSRSGALAPAEPGLEPGLKPGLEPKFGPEFESEFESEFAASELGAIAGLEPGLKPGLEPKPGPEFGPKLEPQSEPRRPHASGITQNEGGYLTSLDGSIPSVAAITFSAYIKGRESDVLTQDSPGCGYGEGYWQVNIGNFSSPWDAGNILKVTFKNSQNGEYGEVEITLQYGGQQTNITLAPPSHWVDDDLDGFRKVDGDCNDSDTSAYPGAPELCDGKDNDCDGVIPQDEIDADGDGVKACEGDCNDRDQTVYLGAKELCDGKDNDCDGVIPQNEADADGDNIRVCSGDCNDHDKTVYPGAPELCDSKDNDCDGIIPQDEIDADGDGISACNGDCDDHDKTVYPKAPELCDGKDNNCNGMIPSNETDADGDGSRICDNDCNENDKTVYPGAPELCDGKDNDCNGVIPENEADTDGDGIRAGNGDCDDNDKTVYPGAPELCDGQDNDCDGVIPENEADADGDGVRVCQGDCDVCQGDCDDSDKTVYPGADEFCDSKDNDCDGQIDKAKEAGCIEDTTVEMQLNAGWNLVALPVEPEDAKAGSIFPDAEEVFEFSMTSMSYTPLGPDGKLTMGKGYWVLMEEAKTFTVSGEPIARFMIPGAQAGWLLIGPSAYPSTVSVDRGTIEVVLGFDGNYVFLGYGSHIAPLEPGHGYWIRLSEQTNIKVEKTLTGSAGRGTIAVAPGFDGNTVSVDRGIIKVVPGFDGNTISVDKGIIKVVPGFDGNYVVPGYGSYIAPPEPW